jgi:DNA-binding PadR family transcriptional regulator
MNKNPIPLTETTFFILFSLSSSPKHGYSIIKEVEKLSEGRVKMAAGTLYGAIKRLVDCGWIEPTDLVKNILNERERKYYRLTKEGLSRLTEEILRIKKLAILLKDHQAEVGI